MNYISTSQLEKMTFPEPRWIVVGLLRTDRRRPSLLVGKPESGKSTLARQLAVSVTKGASFLDRNTKRGAVVYWQSEDNLGDVKDAWNRLGWKQAEDSEIYTYVGNYEEDSCEGLATFLHEHKDVILVVIETLDDLLKLADVKENTAAREAFEKFELKIGSVFSERMAILALWHLKKGETDFAGDSILGASAIRGRTDTKIFLSQCSDSDERRIIHTSKRIGTPIPKTYLVFDPATQWSVLGQTLADAHRMDVIDADQEATQAIVEFVVNHPGCGMRELLSLLKGRTQNKIHKIRSLISSGTLVNRGTKNKFKLYADVPEEPGPNDWLEVSQGLTTPPQTIQQREMLEESGHL